MLYDRPPKIFHPITLQQKHDWFIKIGQQYKELRSSEHDRGDLQSTAFTVSVNNVVKLRIDRPGLLFSSTSWTPDEDFGILMDALQGNFFTLFESFVCEFTL